MTTAISSDSKFAQRRTALAFLAGHTFITWVVSPLTFPLLAGVLHVTLIVVAWKKLQNRALTFYVTGMQILIGIMVLHWTWDLLHGVFNLLADLFGPSLSHLIPHLS